MKEIALDPHDPERVRLLLQVQRGVPIKADTEATLSLQGLTGLASIDLSGGTRESAQLVAKNGETYPVIPSRQSDRRERIITDAETTLGNT